jgi:hypothetical protein
MLAAPRLVVLTVPDADGGAAVLLDLVPVGVDGALDLVAFGVAVGVVLGVDFGFTGGSGLGDGVSAVAWVDGDWVWAVASTAGSTLAASTTTSPATASQRCWGAMPR